MEEIEERVNTVITLGELSRDLSKKYKNRTYEVEACRQDFLIHLSVVTVAHLNGKRERVVAYSPMVREGDTLLEELVEDEKWINGMLAIPLSHIDRILAHRAR